MVSLVARAVVYLIFGFFIYEIIREVNKLFGLSLNPSFAILPAGFIYVVQEVMIRKLKGKEKGLLRNNAKKSSFDRVFYIITWILILFFFLLILAVWVGLVYKQTIESQ
jgi:hypothetical protein